MREAYLGDETDPLDGFEFLTMAEAGEVGHWSIVAKLNERAENADLRKLADWALPDSATPLPRGPRRLAEARGRRGPRRGGLASAPNRRRRPDARPSRDDMTAARPPKAPAFLMGLGLGGFVDGIVFHQILQWHHSSPTPMPTPAIRCQDSSRTPWRTGSFTSRPGSSSWPCWV